MTTTAPVRVYIVDDHPLVREWLANLLRIQPDFQVTGHAADAPEGQGLRGMRERARGAGGDLFVESSPGVGTRLRLTVPVAPSQDASSSSSAEKVAS